MRWREKGGERMEINNLKRNRLGVFRVLFTPQKSTYCCKFIPGLYLRRSKKQFITMMIQMEMSKEFQKLENK